MAIYSNYTRAVRKAFEKRIAFNPRNGKKQLWQALFPEQDVSKSASFNLDRLLYKTFGVTYRQKDQQSNVRIYSAGEGLFIIPPRASEKTPISEELRDAIAVGMEGNEDDAMNMLQISSNISDQHVSGHQMTKNYQALQVFSTGKFVARGSGGTDLSLDIDFSRAGGNATTYDATAVGAKFSEAARAAKQILLDAGAAGDVFFCLAGKNWLNFYRKDTELQAWNQANPLVAFNESQNPPMEFENVDGLVLKGAAHVDGDVETLWVFDYRPGTLYRDSESAAGSAFIGDSEILFGCLGDRRFAVMRGVDCLDSTNTTVREVGEIVFDDFRENDPVTDFIRSQSRHVFVPADVNTTVKITGTFA